MKAMFPALEDDLDSIEGGTLGTPKYTRKVLLACTEGFIAVTRCLMAVVASSPTWEGRDEAIIQLALLEETLFRGGK
jgi:hypothetical protein